MRQETARILGALLKSQCTKSHLQAHPRLWQRDEIGVIQGEIRLYTLGEKAGETATSVSVLSPYARLLTDAIFPGLSTTLHTSAWGMH